MVSQQPSIPDSAACLDCGYSLRGLTEPLCPECGRPFDPADRQTFRDSGAPPWWGRWARPPGRWHCVGMSLLALWAMIDRSTPVGLFDWASGCSIAAGAALFFWIAVGDYILRLSILVFQGRHSQHTNGFRVSWDAWQWAVSPVCVLILVLLLLYSWPVRLRFQLSRGALDRVAQDVGDARPQSSGGQWIGLYFVREVERHENGDVFLDLGTDFWDRIGFLYRPDETAPLASSDWFVRERLAPGWYVGGWRF
jgi:hypothetical protein